MKTVEYMGLKFVDDVYFQNQMESDVDSYLYLIMHHHELNGIVKSYNERGILTDFDFIRKGDNYSSKAFNDISRILDFKLDIKRIFEPNSIYVMRIFNYSDKEIQFRLSFTTIDNAIEFCRRLINYEIIYFLGKSERLFK